MLVLCRLARFVMAVQRPCWKNTIRLSIVGISSLAILLACDREGRLSWSAGGQSSSSDILFLYLNIVKCYMYGFIKVSSYIKNLTEFYSMLCFKKPLVTKPIAIVEGECGNASWAFVFAKVYI